MRREVQPGVFEGFPISIPTPLFESDDDLHDSAALIAVVDEQIFIQQLEETDEDFYGRI